MRIVTATLLVARQAMGQSARGLRLVALSLLTFVPLMLTALIVSVEETIQFSTFAGITLFFSFQIIVPLLALILGVSVLGDEIEGRTLTYLYTRPLPRPVYFIGRMLGLGCFFGILLAISLAGSAALFGSDLNFDARHIASATFIGLVAFGVYLAIFAAIRTILKPALYVGFLWIFVVEGIVSKIPNSGAPRSSVWHHVMVVFTDQFDEFLFPGKVRAMADVGDPGQSMWMLAAIFAGAIAVAVIRLQTTEQRLPAAVA
ncbi:MAG: hypothetical protein V3T86_08515 [Planctomycetota bacterium]